MKDRLNGMRVFAQVVEARSFSAAADKLGMSKSLASRHVSALERALSVKLLNRSTRSLSLTEAGALFYEHCARIVQEAELAERVTIIGGTSTVSLDDQDRLEEAGCWIHRIEGEPSPCRSC